MEKLDVRRIASQGRSDGDGMEYNQYTEIPLNKNLPTNKFYSPDQRYLSNFAPLSSKKKEPKFVPYEPYKAAVSPIYPKKCETVSTHIVIDSQKVSSLASSVIQFDSCRESKKFQKKEIKLTKTEESPMLMKECSSVECSEKVKQLEQKILMLETHNRDLESQFKIQTDVNADLKKMLVAALGEDMQLKVQWMTEDKARLGMNVMQFTEELSLKSEEIDGLSAQCDVWKSKFEASSVMVDELARWKLKLAQQLNQAIFSLESLLKEHKVIADDLATTYLILRNTHTAFNHNSQKEINDQAPQNLLQLSKEIQHLSTSIQEKLLGRVCRINSVFPSRGTLKQSAAEQSALQVLRDYEKLPSLMNEENGIAWLCQNPGKTACQILPHVCPKEPTVNCCKQCSGEIQLL